MTYDAYIKLIDSLKIDTENLIISVLPDIEDSALRALYEWIDTSMEIRNGVFVSSDETISILNDFDSAYLKVLNQLKSYRVAVTSFVKKLPEISNVMQTYQEATNKIDWSKANIAPTERLVVNEILKSLQEDGLNAEFVQPLRDQLYQNIVSGTSIGEAKEGFKDYIKSGKDKSGKLKSYLTQTSQQATAGYTGAINKKLMDTFDYPYLIMSGSIISTSSPQCRFAINDLKGLISEKDWPKVVEVAQAPGKGKTGKWKTGFKDGTTFKNVPSKTLHHACRHEFTPSFLKVGDKIGENETVN